MKPNQQLRRVIVAMSLTVIGCGDTKLLPDAGAEAEPDAAAPDAGSVVTPECAADPASCLYQPARLPIEMMVSSISDPTRIGGTRNIPIAIRYAPTAPRPMPVVVWSHGGAGGHLDPTTSLDEWAIAAAEAGYFAVAIAHEPRDQASRLALCTSLGIDMAGCATFKFLSYDRPLDIALAIDEVAAMSARPEWAGRLDLSKLAVGGHSAGAGGTLMIDGAPRDINGTSTLMSDPRPIAFLAFSPQAPGSDGFTEDSYAHVTRPTLIGTGRGDDNPPDTAEGRASVYDLVQPGNKARIFIEDVAAIHTLFELETDTCVNQTTLAHCNEMRSWVRSAGLAFLDAHLRSSPAAIAWMSSTNLSAASAGVAEWSTR
jgi:hypothetical protein